MIRFLLSALFLPLSLCEFVIVNTSRGLVQGLNVDLGSDKSKTFYGAGQVFLGVPFAHPPTGERRWKLPEPLCKYDAIINATAYRPRCLQTKNNPEPPGETSEDCLYLNIMSPNVSGTYPVMVWIHGGALTFGGADIYHWKGAVRNLVSRGVVVVTIQYRLGMLGFFTTFTERFPPNRGLYDQIRALQWVNEEIAHFGGDTSRITIFGQSAGAVSVSDLSLSPLARGLFHRTVQTSGSSYLELETIEDPRGSIHQKRASQICRINATDWGSEVKDRALLNCLDSATAQELISFDFIDGLTWNSAIDGALLPDYPENLAKSRPKYPVLIGDMLEDFAAFVPGVWTGSISKISRQTVSDILRGAWPNYDNMTIANMTDMSIRGMANGEAPAKDDHLRWAKLVTEIFTGGYFDAGMLKDLEWHRQAGNEAVWLFTFSHRSLLPFHMKIEGWIPVSHSADLPYLWFYPHIWETYNASEADLAVADTMGQMWSDFAKYGKLSHPRAAKEMNYAEIGTNITLKSNWRRKADKVFNEELPNYLGEFPPLEISDESWKKLRKMGEKFVNWKYEKHDYVKGTNRMEFNEVSGSGCSFSA